MKGVTVGKLVRDLIPQIMRAKGLEPVVSAVTGPALMDALLAKLVEESVELREAAVAQRLEEAGDVYEVLMAVSDMMGWDLSDVQEAAARKRASRGAFQEGVWLEQG